jgi:DNA topoisomerase-1
MPKKIKTTTTLIIVESPAKCKKIEEYLGPGYKCIATYGHIRELNSLKNIDIENNFNPTYTIIENVIKKKQIDFLKREIKNADDVIIASDDDREGESIGWHICQLYGLDVNKTKRIVFHEITESALRNAIGNPSKINMDIVHAQQARQILDILVGFKVSPILWKLVSQPKGKDNVLSAGRCQSPALKLVYENQKEIDESNEKKVYNTTGYFTNLNLPFDLNTQIDDEDKMIDFLDESADFCHIYTFTQPIKIFKQPPESFTTSRLQQVASNELHYSPKETMSVCQILYEAGYITYMRTDSKVYSDEFIESAFHYIIKTYDEQYVNQNLRSNDKVTKEENEPKKQSKKKEKKENLAQEAHEAIRPTNILLKELPEEIESKIFGTKERRMYKLIWTNTLESCMSSASYYSITANISAPNETKYSFTSELIDFPGWKIVENKFSRDNPTYQYLQTIKKDSSIQYKKICSKVTIKGRKTHYTEAKLVQLLEEKGIGRPSTFSTIIDKIQERGYIKKMDIKGKEIICRDFELENGVISEIENKREFGNEKGKLVIQQLGVIVMEFLDKHFNPLFNYEYTREMEISLDKISKGELIWFEVCSSLNKEIDNLIHAVKDETKFEIQIDDNNTYIIGKYGPVIKTIEEKDGKEDITFKSVKKVIDLSKLEKGEYDLDDIIETNKKQNTQTILGKYDGKDVILRKGKFGLYVSWGEKSKTLKDFGNRPIENITFEEVKPFLEEGSSIVREINTSLSIRKGPKGDYLFYKNMKMKRPTFHDIKSFTFETKEDYKICDISILKSWIKEKYNI